MEARLSVMVAALVLPDALFPAPTTADEVWAFPCGNQLTYDREVGAVAALTYRPLEVPSQITACTIGCRPLSF